MHVLREHYGVRVIEVLVRGDLGLDLNSTVDDSCLRQFPTEGSVLPPEEDDPVVQSRSKITAELVQYDGLELLVLSRRQHLLGACSLRRDLERGGVCIFA